MSCEICQFNNPKASTTAIIIKDNKVLVVKRNEEPFKDMWDFPGGYVDNQEDPKDAIIREMKEELDVNVLDATFVKTISGTGEWKGTTFPVIGFFYLVEIGDEMIELNEENSEYKWMPLSDLKDVVWDSNQAMARWLKENWIFDMDRIRELTKQLDDSATVNEQSLYKATLNGYVSKIYDDNKMVGLGWIFPRRTMLRNQAVIEDMVIDDTMRGKGYGSELMADLLGWAKANKIEVIELTSGWHRKAAHGLYKKFGFKIHDTAHMLLKI